MSNISSTTYGAFVQAAETCSRKFAIIQSRPSTVSARIMLSESYYQTKPKLFIYYYKNKSAQDINTNNAES